jgi:PPOX class probable F420-dependent enzyme
VTAVIPDEVRAFLARPNHCVMASLRPDGSPHTTATWYALEPDGTILLNMEAGRRRLVWLEGDGRISLTCMDPDNFYRHVSLSGTVIAIHPDPDLHDIDRLSHHYTGAPYPRRRHRRVSVRLRVDSWHGWDRRPDDRVVSPPLPVMPWGADRPI